MEIPEKFPEVIRDFLADLTIAFPEYVLLWEEWQNSEDEEEFFKKYGVI